MASSDDPSENFEEYFKFRSKAKPTINREDAEHAWMASWIIYGQHLRRLLRIHDPKTLAEVKKIFNLQ